ncbi:hypothetical protein ANCDUO_09061 [Ancylostoma duodenale]|uniref:Chromo domain-containing protein n=1 Tax=Ancylostoma duodenale TaxID=51022 RepID=A0A0C2DDZ6_9BILA|nr:hypothetical protein ANCDUO_09061 [Ancylostoma duodenale]
MEVESAASKRKSRRASTVKAGEKKKSSTPKRKNREQEYEVEAIISHSVVDGVVVYQVTWVGYPGEVTDLLEEDLINCGELVQAYKERVKFENLDSVSGVSNGLRDAPTTANSSNGINSPKKSPLERIRKTKPREVVPDAELGYNNGCIVDEYKGFSTKYTEPVVLVSYKEPLPKGFENKQDEIVPIRIIAEKDPKKLIAHLVDLLSNGRGSIVL